MDKRHTALLEALLWVAAILIATGIGVLVYQLASQDPDPVIVAGSLGLILTETVALVAALMRRASERESEQRLLMESGMKAIELIRPVDQGGSVAQSGAALIVLSEMGHHGLALSLLESLWPDDMVNAEAAEVVIDRALRSTDEPLQWTAVSLLAHNGAKTVPAESNLYFLPNALKDRERIAKFDDRVIYSLLSYLVRVAEVLLVERKESDLTSRVIKLGAFTPIALSIAGLDEQQTVLADDPSDRFRTTAVHLVKAIIPFARSVGISGIASFGEEVPFDELEDRINAWLRDHKQVNMALFLRITEISPSS